MKFRNRVLRQETIHAATFVGILLSACGGVDELDESSSLVVGNRDLNRVFAANTPVVEGFNPDQGLPGETVMVLGRNFDRIHDGAAFNPGPTGWRIRMGSMEVPFTYVSPTQLEISVPQIEHGSYRISMARNGQIVSETQNAFVVPPQRPVVRVVNDAQYSMVSLSVNGVEALSYPDEIAPGDSVEFEVDTGPINIEMGLGTWDSDGQANVWFWRTTSSNLAFGARWTSMFSRITIQELLTFGEAYEDWSGVFYDENFAPHVDTFRIEANGHWVRYIDSQYSEEGFLSTVAWPVHSLSVTFRFDNSANGQTVISYPFSTFMLNAGPQSWPLIEYVRQ